MRRFLLFVGFWVVAAPGGAGAANVISCLPVAPDPTRPEQPPKRSGGPLQFVEIRTKTDIAQQTPATLAYSLVSLAPGTINETTQIVLSKGALSPGQETWTGDWADAGAGRTAHVDLTSDWNDRNFRKLSGALILNEKGSSQQWGLACWSSSSSPLPTYPDTQSASICHLTSHYYGSRFDCRGKSPVGFTWTQSPDGRPYVYSGPYDSPQEAYHAYGEHGERGGRTYDMHAQSTTGSCQSAADGKWYFLVPYMVQRIVCR